MHKIKLLLYFAVIYEWSNSHESFVVLGALGQWAVSARFFPWLLVLFMSLLVAAPAQLLNNGLA